MDWFTANQGFKKMLIVIAIRAQKPVFLKATVFLDMSMSTMTMVSLKGFNNTIFYTSVTFVFIQQFLQMSYRFFCVIRTMYA